MIGFVHDVSIAGIIFTLELLSSRAFAFARQVNGKQDFANQPVSHNLINNAFMQYKNGKKPAGFNTGQYRCSGCKLNLEAVHPFTKVSSGGGVVLRADPGHYRCHIQDSNWAWVFCCSLFLLCSVLKVRTATQKTESARTIPKLCPSAMMQWVPTDPTSLVCDSTNRCQELEQG